MIKFGLKSGLAKGDPIVMKRAREEGVEEDCGEGVGKCMVCFVIGDRMRC